MKIYYILDENGFYVSHNYYTTAPEGTVTDVLMTETFTKAQFVNGEWIEGYIISDEEKATIIALHHVYPELAGMNYKLLNLDNLEGIKRDSTLADKGLKGEKKYKKDGTLIWSSEKRYWFQEDGYADGFRRITKIFYLDGSVADQWENFYELSKDDQEFFRKQQRELIFEYFKSQQPELFSLLYAFFKEEIDRYVMKGGSELATTLTDAKDNHPSEIVKQTLSTVVPTQSGGTVTVLDGILYELV